MLKTFIRTGLLAGIMVLTSCAVSPTLNVPGDFNTQDERRFFYHGLVSHFRAFTASPADGQRQHLWFGGANLNTTVFLNGEAVGEHEGGYVPFSFDVLRDFYGGEWAETDGA